MLTGNIRRSMARMPPLIMERRKRLRRDPVHNVVCNISGLYPIKIVILPRIQQLTWMFLAKNNPFFFY
jgi:hypothetical protein